MVKGKVIFEDEEKIECLKRLNIDFLQGYAIGTPSALPAIEEFIFAEEA